jgi:hypothetical protein
VSWTKASGEKLSSLQSSHIVELLSLYAAVTTVAAVSAVVDMNAALLVVFFVIGMLMRLYIDLLHENARTVER